MELAEGLSALTGHHLGHAFFGSDGASATEIALKMSAHHWRNGGQPEKCEFIALRGGYHGETLGALSVTDVPVFRDAYARCCEPRTWHPHCTKPAASRPSRRCCSNSVAAVRRSSSSP